MSKKHRRIFYTILFALLSSFLALPASAQRRIDASEVLKITKLSYDTLKGRLNIRSTTQSTQTQAIARGEWGMIQVNYASNEDWQDEVEIRYHALMFANPKNAEPVFTLLEGKVTYLDIPRSTGLESAMYIHPQTLVRFGRAIAIHAEIWRNGVKAGEADELLLRRREMDQFRLPREWWTQYRPVANRLLNRTQTPFVFEGVDAGQVLGS